MAAARAAVPTTICSQFDNLVLSVDVARPFNRPDKVRPLWDLFTLHNSLRASKRALYANTSLEKLYRLAKRQTESFRLQPQTGHWPAAHFDLR